MIPNKNTFCIAPYQHTEVSPKGYLKVCCVGKHHEEFKFDQIEDWFHSETLTNLRKNLESGVRDSICETCWVHEANGKTSQRQIYNKHIGKIISDNWDINFKKNEYLKQSIKEISTTNIRSFDLKLGNLCNLKCIMCYPGSSSQIMAEAKSHPAVRQFYSDDLNADFTYAESKRFKEWCEKFLKSSLHIKFTGGEPFMNPYLLETLRSIPDEQKKKCILHFTTNLTKVNQEILQIFDKFKEIWLSVSVEGLGDLLEYARYGHQWHRLEENLLTMLGIKNVHIGVNHVVQAPTFIGIRDLVKYFDEKKIDIEALFLTEPRCYHISAVKTEHKKNFLSSMENYNGYNKSFVDSVLNFVSDNLTHDKILAEQCVYRLQTFDKIRKNSFTKVVPVDYFI